MSISRGGDYRENNPVSIGEPDKVTTWAQYRAAEDERERAAVERGIDEQRAWYDTSEELK